MIDKDGWPIIPMCWKCASCIRKEKSGSIGFVMVGCKEREIIHSFEDARELCPLLKKSEFSQESDLTEPIKEV